MFKTLYNWEHICIFSFWKFSFWLFGRFVIQKTLCIVYVSLVLRDASNNVIFVMCLEFLFLLTGFPSCLQTTLMVINGRSVSRCFGYLHAEASVDYSILWSRILQSKIRSVENGKRRVLHLGGSNLCVQLLACDIISTSELCLLFHCWLVWLPCDWCCVQYEFRERGIKKTKASLSVSTSGVTVVRQKKKNPIWVTSSSHHVW